MGGTVSALPSVEPGLAGAGFPGSGLPFDPETGALEGGGLGTVWVGEASGETELPGGAGGLGADDGAWGSVLWADTGLQLSPAPSANSTTRALLRNVPTGIHLIAVVPPGSPGIIEDFRLHIHWLLLGGPSGLGFLVCLPLLAFLPFPSLGGG